MTYRQHVSVIWDIAMMFDAIPGVVTVHSHLYPNAPPAVPTVATPLGGSGEPPVPMAWPGGLLGTHKFTSSVYHNHVWVALDGHDCGPGIAHLCIPPGAPGPCVEAVLDIIGSSRKAKFSAGEVKANGAPIACCTFMDLAGPVAPPTPMVSCGVFPGPNVGTGGTANLFNTVIVGMSGWDMVAGWVGLLIDIVAGALRMVASRGAGKAQDAGGGEAGGAAQDLGSRVGWGGLSGPSLGDLARFGILSLGQSRGEYSGDATLQLWQFQGGPSASSTGTVTRDGTSGDTTFQHVGTTGPDAGLVQVQRQDSYSRTYGQDGSVTDTESDTTNPIYGNSSQTETETTTRRADGSTAHERTVTETDSFGNQRTLEHEGDGDAPPDRDVDMPWSDNTEVPFL